MKTLFFVLILFLFSSCGNEKTNTNLPYKTCIDELITNYTSLEEIENYSKIPKETLIKIYWGDIKSTAEVDILLNELLASFKTDYVETKDEILNDTDEIDFTGNSVRTGNITTLDAFVKNEHLLNLSFQEAINSIIVTEVDSHINTFIEDKFSILNYHNLIWSFVTKSKEEISTNWKNELVNSFKKAELETRIAVQIKSYTNFLNAQRTQLHFNPFIKEPSIKLTNDQIEISQKIQDPIINRLNNEIYSVLFNTIAELLILAISVIIINRLLAARLEKIKRDYEMGSALTGKIKNKTLKWLAGAANNVVKAYRESEEQRKFRRWGNALNFISGLILAIIIYYLYDSRNSFFESDSVNLISDGFAQYLSKQNTYILDFFNNQTQLLKK